MKKLLISIVILVVVVGGAFLLTGSNPRVNGNVVSEGVVDSNGVKTFILTGENFKYVMDGIDNPDLKVKQGDKVRIEFRSTKGFHDWVIDEFSAATSKVRDTEGATVVEFTASEKGTFEYYCSVGQHRANGMKGNLIVE